MVVGKHEKGDIKLKKDAWLRLKGKRFDRNVYSDKKTPKRRTVFAPDVKGRLPKTTTVNWMGNKYKAERTFRYGTGGRRIPAFQWRVSSKAKKKK